MEAAAKEGTGRDGAPDNCVAGIKTGTAQTGAYQGETELMHHWYCGYVEGKTGPAYCVAVFREGGGGGRGCYRPGVPDPGPGPGEEALLAILPCFFQGSGGFSSPSGG